MLHGVPVPVCRQRDDFFVVISPPSLSHFPCPSPGQDSRGSWPSTGPRLRARSIVGSASSRVSAVPLINSPGYCGRTMERQGNTASDLCGERCRGMTGSSGIDVGAGQVPEHRKGLGAPDRGTLSCLLVRSRLRVAGRRADPDRPRPFYTRKGYLPVKQASQNCVPISSLSSSIVMYLKVSAPMSFLSCSSSRFPASSSPGLAIAIPM